MLHTVQTHSSPAPDPTRTLWIRTPAETPSTGHARFGDNGGMNGAGNAPGSISDTGGTTRTPSMMHLPVGAPAARRRRLSDLALRGRDRRSPDGRKLTEKERTSLALMPLINADILDATTRVEHLCRRPDTVWLLHQFLNPLDLARRKSPKLPARTLLLRAVAFLEGIDDEGGDAHPEEVPDLHRAIEAWCDAMARRRSHPAWAQVSGTAVTMRDFQDWQHLCESMPLEVIPRLSVPAEFERALALVGEWDDVLQRRGHTGERFSLREELVRLHNWPGDQWNSGDDYASAQKRFHRRLDRARALREDPVRDRIMHRALYLREGLLLNPVEDLDWFLAVCHFRWESPDTVDIRPDLASWRLLDALGRLGQGRGRLSADDVPAWIDAPDPRGVPAELLTAVGGPGVMIDLDEDVVAALPPGCQVRRLTMGARGPLGPDWSVYWVDSEWDDSRPILDLVESAKLHPSVVFVSDEEPRDLAELVRPFLDVAFEIPTNPLTAYSHSPGIAPRVPEHQDAGLD